MFGGSFTHKLDEVGRFIVPRKFRYSLGERFVVTRGLGCLLVLTTEQFGDLSRQTQGLGDLFTGLFNPEIGKLRRHIFSEMIETGVDGQGRVQLTQELRDSAGIDKELVIFGAGDWLEIWSAERWKEYKDTNLTPEQLIGAAELVLRAKEGGQSGEGVPPSGPEI